MSVPTSSRSTYPVSVDELLPRARELAERLGAVPSRNRLMSEFRIGARKATTLRAALEAPPADSGVSDEGSGPGRLRLVPEPAESGDSTDSGEPTGEPPVPGGESLGDEQEGPTSEEVPTPEPAPEFQRDVTAGAGEASEPDTVAASPGSDPAAAPERARRVPAAWPVLLLALPAFVAIWSGWVGLGSLTGFGMVHPLPGIADGFAINTAITLPIGVETYAAYALRVWLSGTVPPRARRFAKVSALGSLGLGALGQIAYHLMTAADITHAPWWITTLVACLPVAVLGMGAALTHLLHTPTATADREAR